MREVPKWLEPAPTDRNFLQTSLAEYSQSREIGFDLRKHEYVVF